MKREMNTSKMTVVFEVKDREAMMQLYEAHKFGATICGLMPNIIAWGDQVTTPGEILDGLLEIDPEFPSKRELQELCDMAENHRSDN